MYDVDTPIRARLPDLGPAKWAWSAISPYTR